MGLTPQQFRGQWAGQTVWVLGSGATVNYLPPGFLDGRNVVAVNYSGLKANVKQFVTVSNHHDDAQAVAEARPNLLVVTTEVEQVPEQDRSGVPATAPNILRVPSIEQPFAGFSTEHHWPTDPELFTVGPTSAHLALRWAWYVGAAHIVLVGIDCGYLDGTSRVDGYPANPDGSPGVTLPGLWESTLRDIAGRLRDDGVGVVSLNPFVSLALEGHVFSA